MESKDQFGYDYESRAVAPTEVSGIVFTSLFSALIAVGSYLIVPLPGSPVPIVLQNFFILLAGLVLGPKRAVMSVAVFLLVGIVGLPVFSGAKGGIAHFIGPTGGFLLSYLPAVVIVGCISGRGDSRIRDVLALVAGTAAVYLVGVPWLGVSLGLTPARAIGMGVLPFLAGDALKLVAALFIAPLIRPFFPKPVSGKRTAGSAPA